MAFELNRIDGMSALPYLRAENVHVHVDEATIELSLQDCEIGLFFPAPEGVVDPCWLVLAAEVLGHLTAMDNEVQRVCAKDWARAGQPQSRSYYEGHLASIRLIGSGHVVLEYSVIGCNSEWDEGFVRNGDRWVRIER